MTEKQKFPAEILNVGRTILFVDDEDIISEVGEALLKELGFRVMLAGNGEEAIDIYKQHWNEIDMVMLDMIMPDISGGETYDFLKGINSKIKVLLSTGYSLNGHATEILERGCDGFIQKPFNLNQLSRSIREVLDKE